jgi:two-component system OmpR family response regulator
MMAERPNRDGVDGEGLRGLRVLLLDDHADTLSFMTRLLSRMGAEVVAAATCEAARYAMRTLDGFDLLVTDVMLDDGDGLELAAELRRAHNCSVFILSGVERAPAALPAGVDLWLAKPIQVGQFEAAIRGLPENRGSAGDGQSGGQS